MKFTTTDITTNLSIAQSNGFTEKEFNKAQSIRKNEGRIPNILQDGIDGDALYKSDEPANILIEVSFDPDDLLSLEWDEFIKLTQFQAIVAIANLVKRGDIEVYCKKFGYSRPDKYLEKAKYIATAHGIPFVPEHPKYIHQDSSDVQWLNSNCADLPFYENWSEEEVKGHYGW